MSELADVLELLHTSSHRWQTLEAVGYDWDDDALRLEAFLRGTETADRSWGLTGPGVVGRGHSVSFSVDTNEEAEDLQDDDEDPETWRLWIEQPERRRAEFGAGGEMVTVVWVGNTWWSWGPQQQIMTNGGQTNSLHGKGPSEALVETEPHVGHLDLEVVGREDMLGRPVFTVRGSPRGHPHERHFLHGLGSGADEYFLSVDAERGVILRSEARLHDRPFTIIAMTEVAFDRPLPAETFLVPGQHAGS